MKQKFIFLIGILFLILNNINAQKSYYSRNKKIILSEDTSTLIVKVKQNASYLRIANLLANEITNFDTVSLKDLALIKFISPKKKLQSINLIKSDTSVLYTSNFIKEDNIPFIPTGEILLIPKQGANFSKLLIDLNLTLKIESSKKAFDITVLRAKDGEDVFEIANKIYESGQVNWCHPNFFVPIEHFTNDPLYSQQFYLKNTGQGGGTAGIDLNVEPAWGITKGNANIKIAVIDEGVEDHEDLSGRVLNGFTPRDQINGNGRPTSSGKHGQACAGIIAASQDNNIGIAGIAPNCRIVPVNIFYGGETTLDLANGINWAWNQGQADVLSNSWGYGTSSSSGFDAITQAITNARTQGRGGKGSIVVFASGNGSTSVSFPGNVQDVITVGAIQKNGTVWGYSNTGPSMDVVAVSGDVNLLGDIVTTDRMGTLGYEPGNYTPRFGGTSAACPQVAGVVALILSINPNLTEFQVRNIIQSTSTDMGATGFDDSYGYGRLNACAAVTAGFKITGDDIVCTTSGNYFVPNLPPGVTIEWKATPAGIVIINSPNSLQTTLTKIGNSVITLNAIISTLCGGTVTLSKEVVIGTGTTSINFTQLQVTCESRRAYFFGSVAPVPLAGNQYDWYSKDESNPNNPFILQQSNLGNGADFPLGGGDRYYTIRVIASNPCGTLQSIDAEGSVYAPSCAGGLIVKASPNPTSNILSVRIVDQGEQTYSIRKDKFYELQLIDKQGALKRRQKYNNGTILATVNLANLQKGLYFLRLWDGKHWKSSSVVKQ